MRFNVEARVAAGRAFLEEMRNSGRFPELDYWFITVIPETLDIEYPSKCMLGQLFGSFDQGCSLLDLDDDSMVRLGFIAHALDPYSFEAEIEHEMLTIEWKRVVRDRAMRVAATTV
jgi:hypothetical protein